MREYDDVLFQSAITPVSCFCRLATNKGRQSYLFRAPSATVGQSQSSSLSPSTPMEQRTRLKRSTVAFPFVTGRVFGSQPAPAVPLALCHSEPVVCTPLSLTPLRSVFSFFFHLARVAHIIYQPELSCGRSSPSLKEKVVHNPPALTFAVVLLRPLEKEGVSPSTFTATRSLFLVTGRESSTNPPALTFEVVLLHPLEKERVSPSALTATRSLFLVT